LETLVALSTVLVASVVTYVVVVAAFCKARILARVQLKCIASDLY